MVHAACNEWDAIVTGTQGIIGATITTNTVMCAYCDVPVVQSVPVGRHPPIPGGMKIDSFFSGTNLQPAAQYPGTLLGNPHLLGCGLYR